MVDVSIVISCYKQEQFITAAIASAQGQRSGLTIEVIVQHDGCASGAHAGASANRNKAINRAKGEWIICLDADDLLPENYVEALYDSRPLHLGQEQIVGCPVQFISGSRLVRFDMDEMAGTQLDIEDFRHSIAIPVSAMFRRCDWKAVGGYDVDVKVMEDWDFWYKILSLPNAVYLHTHDTCLLKNNIGQTKTHRETNSIRMEAIKRMNEKYGLSLPLAFEVI